MTFWPRNHPVMFPDLHTDHWSKMKTMVPVYLASVPAALLKDKGALHGGSTDSSSLLPPLDKTTANDPVPSMLQRYSLHQNTQKTSPQNMLRYRNVFNDRARSNFCYWFVERRSPSCKGNSFGAYKTALGLPKV